MRRKEKRTSAITQQFGGKVNYDAGASFPRECEALDEWRCSGKQVGVARVDECGGKDELSGVGASETHMGSSNSEDCGH
ncbi:hypothetical protein E2C01_094340 [Portunus trituberculatus]|uniref:Uncharacterized protein n=1 Tax=Portunus trituberculatus TaxID=210409 RepID=A0A5B7JLL7_PORTR|nr:hypothetical protein [Portunus trituberculatus]